MHETLTKIFKEDFDSFFLIAGPCVVESESVCMEVAETVSVICEELAIPYIFKSSFIKANRTKVQSFTGIEQEQALNILTTVKSRLGVALTTDIHETSDVDLVKGVVDLLQIPAFLCRQTSLLQAAGSSGLPVNIKKGQFMSGQAMHYAAEKVRSTGNPYVMLTERGNTFGYENLVVDGRNIAIMSEDSLTVMDVTHSNQQPNQAQGVSGGRPKDVGLMGRLGLSAGAKGIFMEIHPNPKEALSDASTMIELSMARDFIMHWRELSLTLNKIRG